MKQFESNSINHDLDEVDAIEDIVIDIIHKTVPAENAFFLHALDKGTLPQEWVSKVLDILSDKQSFIPDAKNAICNAIIEKNTKKVKKLATTKRHVRFDLPKKFGVTRRKEKNE